MFFIESLGTVFFFGGGTELALEIVEPPKPSTHHLMGKWNITYAWAAPVCWKTSVSTNVLQRISEQMRGLL